MSDHGASPGSSRCKGHLGTENRCDPLHHTSSILGDAGKGGERERERERINTSNTISNLATSTPLT